MKRKVIELDTKSSRKERGLGDAPVLGKVAKVSDSGQVSEPEYEDEIEDESDPEAGEWLIKLGMISALMIGLIVGAAVIYFTALSKLKSPQLGSSEGPREEAPAGSTVDDSGNGMIGEEEALDLVRRGLTVRFASKVNDYFLYTPNLDAPQVVEFLRKLSETDGLVVRMEWLEPLDQEVRMLPRVRIHFSSNKERPWRDAYLVQGDNGLWKIDFDSFAQLRLPVIDLKQEEEEADSP